MRKCVRNTNKTGFVLLCQHLVVPTFWQLPSTVYILPTTTIFNYKEDHAKCLPFKSQIFVLKWTVKTGITQIWIGSFILAGRNRVQIVSSILLVVCCVPRRGRERERELTKMEKRCCRRRSHCVWFIGCSAVKLCQMISQMLWYGGLLMYSIIWA